MAAVSSFTIASALRFLVCVTLATSSAVANDVVVPSNQGNANNAFAIALYKAIGASNPTQNVFFSPASIWIGLGMLYAGAGGQTKSQLAKAMHLDGDSSKDTVVNEDFQRLLKALESPNINSYTLSVANRLFGQKGYNFSDAYCSVTEEFFLARLKELNFQTEPDVSRVFINNWVAKKTLNKVQNLLPDDTISDSTVLVLVNAIYFKSLWNYTFDKSATKNQTFHLTRNDATTIEMMTLRGTDLNFHNSTDLGCHVLELPYVGGKASMFIFLPHDIEGLSSVEDRLRADALSQVFGALKSERVTVFLPKFVFDQGVALKQFLEGIGIVDAFDKSKADLSGIDGSKRLVVTEVMHKAYVAVDEEGTEAAGSTGAVINTKSFPSRGKEIDFVVDRPFLFLIVEKTTGSVLFLGRLLQSPQLGDQSIGSFGKTGEQRSFAGPRVNAGADLGHLLPAMFLTVSFLDAFRRV